jgi:hypothetical protein
MIRRLQESQLSAQALTRLSSAGVFLLASRLDSRHLALVAIQGALLAIPYTLIESLVGRPQSAGVVPDGWDIESWARRAAGVVVAPVAVVCFTAVSIALPRTGIVDRLLVITPVLLQLPLEAMFWAMARTRPRGRANLVPQVVAAGTLLGALAFAAAGVRLDVAAVPAQLAVLAWMLAPSAPRGAGIGGVVPGAWPSVRIGGAYCTAAVVDLGYAVALPSMAGALAGPAAIVVLRAMELAFGPFHVALSATTREDVVAGRAGRFRTAPRALTVALLVAISLVVVGSPTVRGWLSADLAATGRGAVALYCAYKAGLMVSTWLSVRHVVRAAPRRYLLSAIGSRVIAFGGVAAAVLWVDTAEDLFLQLAVIEAGIVAWYALRVTTTRLPVPDRPPVPALRSSLPAPTPHAGGRIE